MSFIRKAFTCAALLSLADCSMTSGRYGGQILDNADMQDAAKVYRTGGIVVNGFAQLVMHSVGEFAREVKTISDKHGNPRP